ncbi:MAG TPA: hypothetical protein VG319_14530 [Polyangia bacterium]|nr:hypothetical protein [Polyangia bacterium]
MIERSGIARQFLGRRTPRVLVPVALAALAAAAFVVASCRGSSGLTGAAGSATHAGDSRGQGGPVGSGPVSAEIAPGGAGTPAAAPGAVGQVAAPPPRVLVVEGGHERWMEPQAAAAAGYTIVDLSDDWTPYIFAPQNGPDGQPLSNRYRRIFIGLANDQLDEDGEPLPPGEKNYLELYGIFPSLSVLRARFLADEQHPCHDEESADALEAAETVTYVAPTEVAKDARRLAKIREELEKARRAAKAPTLEALAAAQPAFAPKVKLVEKRAAEKPAMAAVERRLTCEGLLGNKKDGKKADQTHHAVGLYDDAMRIAVRRFQQKHMIYEANYLRRKTVEALARPLLDNDYDGFRRAMQERVVAAASILEDGSTKAGNLVEDFTKVALDGLGLVDAASTLAFFKRHPAAELKTLRAGVKLPPRPAYYADQMDLSIVVDRGDIWYDLPFDEKGNFHYQPRKKYPSLTVYAKVGGRLTALARWRTTIGSWRAEQASDGYEYYRYKMSDVGPRVIRQVVSGPVWIAPASTPIRTLVKHKAVNGKWMKVVNYDELGPGFLSAYGLIAGYFVVPGQNGRPDFDNGVRAHGSSDYLSIYSANGFSHGCHRLPNHLAIRMYSFILQHRQKRVVGDSPMGFQRQFLFEDMVYEMRIPSRGYVYVLDPPLPVTVLEGNILGDQKTPIIGYVPKPGVVYPGPPPPAPDSPEAKAGGGAAPAGAGGDE